MRPVARRRANSHRELRHLPRIGQSLANRLSLSVVTHCVLSEENAVDRAGHWIAHVRNAQLRQGLILDGSDLGLTRRPLCNHAANVSVLRSGNTSMRSWATSSITYQ
jgi:hypothetical protein